MAWPMTSTPAHPDIAVGLTAGDYAARRCATCVACGSVALDDDADYCRRCALVAQVLRAWGPGEISHRIALVLPTLPIQGDPR